ncbi:DUF4118 domain-containing protein [Dactylosporangium siamense]|uniref:histidine kinase n=1 Tax=Dactylosporangium siamense TaxID=685454 RepID=A0A919Q0Y0_9ACTN|nr:DUF4118 domain-containing protein [Dactylosporangium siamense]GIG52173.1 hypothetical protein Dsi01nite_102140 [Dactylosporangium siamense]
MTVTNGVRRRLTSWTLPTRPPLLVGVAVAAMVIAAETAILAMLQVAHPHVQPSAGVYILGVVAVTTVWGTRLGIAVALASTVVFNVVHVPPGGLHLSLVQDGQRALIFGIVAVISGWLADLARERSEEAHQRADEAEISVEVARQILGEDDLASGLRAGSRRLAARFGLPRVSIEVGDATVLDSMGGATVLKLGDGGRPAVRLVVPATTPPKTLERLRDRLGPALGSIVRTAIERQELIDTLRTSQQATQALLAEQAALQRVATMVATGGSPAAVFAAVTAELHGLFPGFHTALMRYESDRTVTAISERDERGDLLSDHPNLPIEGQNIVSTILRTRRTARVDYDTATGPIARELRSRGIHLGLGVPIVVDGELWGVTLVMSYQPQPIPDAAEKRLLAFTELVATTIANTENRARLISSRVRLVTAADDARRRIERDLHDGPQQRIVSLALRLRMAEESALNDLPAARQLLAETVRNLTEIHESMTDLARGIHPALLTQGGIGPMLRKLARRSIVPVELRLKVPKRLPERVEVAVYYVVSEALTNITKHSRASVACVAVESDERSVWLSVHDDGIGGAKPGDGTGLVGLRDRVEALGGRFGVTSPVAAGTTLTAEIPLAEPDADAAAEPFPLVSAGSGTGGG